MFVWVCDGDLREKGGGGGGGEWVIWSRGKWKPSFRPQDLSRKLWLLRERFGSLAAVSENMEREEEGRGGRTTDLRGGIKTELGMMKRQRGMYGERRRAEPLQNGRMKGHSETHRRKHPTRPGKNKWMRADSCHSCLLFPVISSSLGAVRILGAGPLLEFTV